MSLIIVTSHDPDLTRLTWDEAAMRCLTSGAWHRHTGGARGGAGGGAWDRGIRARGCNNVELERESIMT